MLEVSRKLIVLSHYLQIPSFYGAFANLFPLRVCFSRVFFPPIPLHGQEGDSNRLVGLTTPGLRCSLMAAYRHFTVYSM